MMWFKSKDQQVPGSERANVSVQVRRQGKVDVAVLKAIKQEEFILSWGRVSLFILFTPSTNWIQHIGEGNLLYSYQFKCCSHTKTPSQTHPG